jgi:hypothetical protein
MGAGGGVAGQAALLEVGGENTAESGLISGGLVFGETEGKRELVLLRVMEVARFDEARRAHRQAVERRYAQQKADPVPLAANGSFDRIIELRATGHLRVEVENLADSAEGVLNIGRRAFGVGLRVVCRKLLGGGLPGSRHVGGHL